MKSLLQHTALKFLKRSKPTRASFIFYKIVDTIKENYIIQCINTKATISASISDIVNDCQFLYALHPAQACYIGIKYAEKSNRLKLSINHLKFNARMQDISRYGKYALYSQERKKKFTFIDKENQTKFTMNAQDIASSDDIINEFDSIQAFYIGLMAGTAINCSQKTITQRKNHLTLVKTRVST